MEPKAELIVIHLTEEVNPEIQNIQGCLCSLKAKDASDKTARGDVERPGHFICSQQTEFKRVLIYKPAINKS